MLEFGLFHGDPHPGNIFCLRDGRIAYVDFGNVAQLSNSNKQVGSCACMCCGCVGNARVGLTSLSLLPLFFALCCLSITSLFVCRSLFSNEFKQVLIDAVVHAVNEDYEEMAGDFIKLGFLSAGEWLSE